VVVHIEPFILVARSAVLPSAAPEPVLESALEHCPIGPSVLALPIRFTV
jgi:hypothetical protein